MHEENLSFIPLLVVLGLAFVVLAEALGLETILGAFLAGAIVSLILGNDGHELREKLDGLGYGFLIPVFFVMVGVELDLRRVLASGGSLALVAVLVGVAYAVKIVPSLLLLRRFGGRTALAGGALLSSRLSLIIAAAAIGLQLGIIDQVLHSALVLVAVVTSSFSPPLFGWLAPPAPLPSERMLIVGDAVQAQLLANRLRHSGFDPLVVRSDERGSPVHEGFRSMPLSDRIAHALRSASDDQPNKDLTLRGHTDYASARAAAEASRQI